MAVFNSYGDRVDMMADLAYRPETDRSRMETLPYYPSLDIARAQPLPYRPQEKEAETLIGQGADFLNSYIKGLFSSPTEVAGGIPVGEDPDLPMTQEQFNDYVRGRIEGRGGVKMREALKPYGGSIIQMIRQNRLKGV